MSAADGQFSLLGRDPPLGQRLQTIAVAAGGEMSSHPTEWAGALVVVECGVLEVECARGSRASFPAGSLLCLALVPVRWLRNRGEETVVLTVLSRLEKSGNASPGFVRPDR
jgi:hypothetical protein